MLRCKHLSMMCVALFLVIISALALTAMDTFAETITVEGESLSAALNGIVSRANTSDANCSGGAYLLLKTGAGVAIPSEGITASFDVNVPTAGAYQLDLSAMSVSSNSASPYYISVNNGEYVRINSSNTVQYGTIPSALAVKYHISPTMDLDKGINTISFRMFGRVDDARVWFQMDCFQLTLVTAAPTPTPAPDYKIGNLDSSVAFNAQTVTINKGMEDGGKWVTLYSDGLKQVHYASGDPLPAGGATVSFNVSVPSAAKYRFYAATSSINNDYYSPYGITVNGADMGKMDVDKVLESTPLLGFGGDLTQYRYNDIQLNAGNNTITFIVNDRLTVPEAAGMAVFHIDYIALTKAKTTETFFVDPLALRDMSGGTLTPAPGSDFRVHTRIVNKSNAINDVTVFAALYDSNRLIEIKTYSENFAQSSQVNIDPSFTLPTGNINQCKVKIFVWDSRNGLTPLASSQITSIQ